ncbi:hypothetical protein N7492_008148 [Penicillium capsulatum]|uniref:Uncharacterized protein n=1 Tax=Penicillium capsulatum TaxID=69766 RepID=A0A9W9HS21_9EURO|nr:hypothetical protein N7492_008148 [Penicillium capsulatum]KAJ6105559.1 hypothetical protein N7512_009076 [Penicillium capsulatum]
MICFLSDNVENSFEVRCPVNLSGSRIGRYQSENTKSGWVIKLLDYGLQRIPYLRKCFVSLLVSLETRLQEFQSNVTLLQWQNHNQALGTTRLRVVASFLVFVQPPSVKSHISCARDLDHLGDSLPQFLERLLAARHSSIPVLVCKRALCNETIKVKFSRIIVAHRIIPIVVQTPRIVGGWCRWDLIKPAKLRPTHHRCGPRRLVVQNGKKEPLRLLILERHRIGCPRRSNGISKPVFAHRPPPAPRKPPDAFYDHPQKIAPTWAAIGLPHPKRANFKHSAVLFYH